MFYIVIIVSICSREIVMSLCIQNISLYQLIMVSSVFIHLRNTDRTPFSKSHMLISLYYNRSNIIIPTSLLTTYMTKHIKTT